MKYARDVVIVGGVRTAHGKFKGALFNTPAVELGAMAISSTLEQTGVDGSMVDEVIMGNVLSAGIGQHPARQSALKSGIPAEIPALTINKMCGSSMKAIMLAANSIRAKESKILMVGGMESMSRAPFTVSRAEDGKVSMEKPIDSMMNDGLIDPFNGMVMAQTGNRIAEQFGITREESDLFAIESHIRAHNAHKRGDFADYHISVEHENGVLKTDEGIRPDSSLEALAKLNPVFDENGVVTAGNASQISDGAAACLVMSREKAEQLELEPLATITGYCAVGIEHADVMSAPIPTVHKLWKMLGRDGEKDYDLYEHNEAFASACLGVMQELGLKHEKLNVHGGAVAMGHPLGASGCRIVLALIHALRRKGGKRGFATACLGGGMATAIEVEV
ncbi:MAG: thiolase family protein [Candidatus Poseidoniia archaeon]|jgi:acetyl-CoA C-acetyltransferase|nr:thiolase family protein [Candidatus Poseidoniia archaeon]MDP7187999.1 thiolase family protein [Candidatus Poseidoniia archaeon]HJN31977.1 thiolase family protein [Candidatus Poseidoniia archaeon]|tara:strand:- start:1317 stop:2489 length:1173 start_codon:yes stop_codon:yes gene_type:complete